MPEVSFVTAHGQMAAGELDDRMNAFYDGKYDVLLATTIVESGIDIPTANTMVIHRADMYGLAQLYQIRGRVGRAKTRAYAYLTTKPRMKLTPAAEKRLRVLGSLDSLGAGFTIASQDLDIRGAGNIVGEEQSGACARGGGFELYQSMLEEAIAKIRSGEAEGLVEDDGQWSPQINLGVPVLIPEEYVPDLDVRLGLYRRLSQLETKVDLEGFAAELIDRFGKLPPRGQHAASGGSDQDHVQTRPYCEARRRAEGRDDPVPQRQVPQSQGVGGVRSGPAGPRQGQGQQDRRAPGLGAGRPTRSRAPSPSHGIWRNTRRHDGSAGLAGRPNCAKRSHRGARDIGVGDIEQIHRGTGISQHIGTATAHAAMGLEHVPLFSLFFQRFPPSSFVPPGLMQGFFPTLHEGLPAAWWAFVDEGIRRGADHVAHHIENVGGTLAVHMIFGGLAVILIPLQVSRHVAQGRPAQSMSISAGRWCPVVTISALTTPPILVQHGLPALVGGGLRARLDRVVRGVGHGHLLDPQGATASGYRRWMVMMAALCFGAVSFRLQLPVLRLFFDQDVVFPYLGWTCWVPNVLVVAWWWQRDLARQRGTTQTPPPAMNVTPAE